MMIQRSVNHNTQIIKQNVVEEKSYDIFEIESSYLIHA